MALPYVYALLSNMLFGFVSQVYTYYGRKFSSLWVNAFKAFIAGLFFILAVLVSGGFNPIHPLALAAFLASGALGLGIADIFIVKAFAGMGPGRTLMLYSFQPLFVGILSFFLFGQVLDSHKLVSIIFFVMCVLIFSLESYNKDGHFNIKNTLFAFIGVAFDGSGVLLTRYGFNHAAHISTFEGNFYRALSAMLLFYVISRFKKFSFRENFNSLAPGRKAFVIFAVFMGTFMSLSLYLSAIRVGTLAVLTSISVTSVIFASVFECVWERKMPSKYLLAAFGFFFCGMYILLF